MIKNKDNKVVIFQAKSGAIELKGDFSSETIWATQAQIALLFGVDLRTVNEHIRNILNSSELDESATLRNFRIVQKEGERDISRELKHYNLDMIISVGYRVNSKTATQFRQWATQTLRSHIVDGYTVNKSRIGTNYAAFTQAIADVRALLPAETSADTDSILELVTLFADTWFSLDAYDRDELVATQTTKKKVSLTAEKLAASVAVLKSELIKKGEATDIFAVERTAGALEGIVGNVLQSFGGQELYVSVEEKAAHLLYFIIKNHPFIDGNKRTGAYSFIWFLRRSGLLDMSRITPVALTALTLLIAQSNPKEKEKMIGLVMVILRK
ncbi:MAG: virulence protein RhuM/Fic/DOC family protein [Patescibacteria group bacterium]